MFEANNNKKDGMAAAATVSPDTPLLDAKAVAVMLGVSVKTVMTLVRNGELPVVFVQALSRAGGCKCYRFTIGDVRGYIASKRRQMEPLPKKKRGRKPRQQEEAE